MRPLHLCRKAAVPALVAIGMGLAVVPAAYAEPDQPDPTDQPAVAPGPAIVSGAAPTSDTATPAAVEACAKFATALDYAATNYSDFANNLAGMEGNYSDVYVSSSNGTGRTALREAASFANEAANTPDLDPAIADPMRSWATNANKLMILMGVRAPVDGVNGKANDLNTDAHNAQMACAQAGTHA
ncbi:hypothetical protein BST43_00180 [Mycobacteroides saopaulense]|uniref:Secreted protein n=1 Tax=Mycobacteroides saopaulense TaxID=1578165 RepID=A0A1S4VRQ9_9MYCO|nr:hypothetical protein [Mycobacteroides saopaulense]ALR12104.1 hypothetical protein MYCSP_12460 [Mycobacteroides saopaulense]ORB60710.1 hypothetical protein BST43_00180 [Mycobacteroides saopaulense]